MPSRVYAALRPREESLYLANRPAADSFFVKDAEKHSFSIIQLD
jgi:hypothetical protein